MDQQNLNPIFQLTDPTYGKSQAEILQERIKAAQSQNLASQMQRAQELQGKLQKTPEKKFNKGGAIAAALADIVAPQTGTFDKFMAISKSIPDERKQVADELARTQAGIGNTSALLDRSLNRGSGLAGQKELALLRSKLGDQSNQASLDRAKELYDYKKQKEGGQVGELTAGEKKVDQSFAPDYQSWISGGFSNVKSNLKKLEGVMGRLAEGQPEIGGNMMPQAVRAFTEPSVVGLEQDVESITFQSLKEILGGNFTKGEADRMVAQAYDPKLSNEQNREKIKSSYKNLQEKMEAKQAAVEHFAKYGSLKGFQGGDMETMDDFYKKTKKDLLEGKSSGDEPDWDNMTDEEIENYGR